MKLENIKRISTGFFYWWYNQNGMNTEQGFDKWMLDLEDEILVDLQGLEIGYASTLYGISETTGIDKELIRIILKRLREEGIVRIMMIFSESTGLANGSGYCLESKNR